MRNYKYYEELGTDIWSLNARDMYDAALAYRLEVIKRLRVAERHKELREVKAYRNLEKESMTGSRQIIATYKKPGETTAQWRDRLMQEIARARRYIHAQTSTWGGYQAWRNNTLNAIAEATGLTRRQLGQRLRGDKLKEFLRFFEDVKHDGNMLAYLADSDSTFRVAYYVFVEDNLTPEERLEKVGKRINEWYEEKDRQEEEFAKMVASGSPEYPPAFI